MWSDQRQCSLLAYHPDSQINSCTLSRTSKRTLNPLSIEQGLRIGTAARFHFTTLDAFEVERLGYLRVVEEVLHDKQVRLSLSRAALQVFDLDGIESKELREDSGPARGRFHVLEVRRPQIDQDLPAWTSV